MTMSFLGNVGKLRKCVSKTGISGNWREIENHQMQYHADNGAVLNWWESTGTVTVQGRKLAARKLRKLFVRVALKKNLLEDHSLPADEIDDLRRQLKHVLIDIAKLKEAVQIGD